MAADLTGLFVDAGACPAFAAPFAATVEVGGAVSATFTEVAVTGGCFAGLLLASLLGGTLTTVLAGVVLPVTALGAVILGAVDLGAAAFAPGAGLAERLASDVLLAVIFAAEAFPALAPAADALAGLDFVGFVDVVTGVDFSTAFAGDVAATALTGPALAGTGLAAAALAAGTDFAALFVAVAAAVAV